MSRIRKIIHLDLDAFFCAVEELRRPELRGVAFAVGGMPDERGVVSSCSYPARHRGVHSAMPMAQALRACPGLIIVSPDHKAYAAASERVMAILRDLTGLVEQISVDEAFLDVSDLPSSGVELGRQLQERIRTETRLPCSLGIAANKLVAKIATDVGKQRYRGDGSPRAILEVIAGDEAAFLAPLPVRMLWGVGKKTELRLQGMGIATIGALAQAPAATLRAVFGKNGDEMARHARGVDDRPVVVEHEIKSISQEVTYTRDVADKKVVIETLRELSAEVAGRLREAGLRAGTVRVKLRREDFSTLTRQASMAAPVDQDQVIFQAAQGLLEKAWQAGHKVRLIGVGASGLTQEPEQLSLWDTPSEKERRLLEAVDELKQKFGSQVINSGRAMTRQAPTR